jgi:hypothetical protein
MEKRYPCQVTELNINSIKITGSEIVEIPPTDWTITGMVINTSYDNLKIILTTSFEDIYYLKYGFYEANFKFYFEEVHHFTDFGFQLSYDTEHRYLFNSKHFQIAPYGKVKINMPELQLGIFEKESKLSLSNQDATKNITITAEGLTYNNTVISWDQLIDKIS